MEATWMGLKMELAFGVIVWQEIALGVRQFAQGVYSLYIYKYETAYRYVHENMCVMHCDTY